MITPEELDRILYHYNLGQRGVRKTSNFSYIDGDKVVFTVSVPIEKAVQEFSNITALLQNDERVQGAGLISDLFSSTISGKVFWVTEELEKSRVVGIVKGYNFALAAGFVYLDKKYQGLSTGDALVGALQSASLGYIAGEFTGTILGALLPSPTMKIKIAKFAAVVAASYVGGRAGEWWGEDEGVYTFAVEADIDEFYELASSTTTRHAESILITQGLRRLDDQAQYSVDYETITRIGGEYGNINEEPSIYIASAPTGSYDLGDLYEVQSGDTLSELAERFGTTVDALAEANGINDPDKIYTGGFLVVPSDQGNFNVDLVSEEWLESVAASQGTNIAGALDLAGQSLLNDIYEESDWHWVSADFTQAYDKSSALTSGMSNGVVGKAVGNTSFTSGFGFMGDFGQGLQNSFDFDTYEYTGALGVFGVDQSSEYVNDFVNKTVNSGGGSSDGFGSGAAGIAVTALVP